MVLEVEGLSVRFAIGGGLLARARGFVQAVDDVSLTLAAGQTLAVVGESGSGKTTLGRAILRLVEAERGVVRIAGQDWRALDPEALRASRWRAQMVFQDPLSSLSPHKTVRQIVEAPRVYAGLDVRGATALIERVGLGAELFDRLPAALSGGQRQRVAIARALATEPELLVLDEALSALDASVAAQILNLLASLRDERKLAYLFIAHDLSAVRWLADRVVVMYFGRVVEEAPARELFEGPLHPYTRALMAAMPSLASRALPEVRVHEPPNPLSPPSGCAFAGSCPIVVQRCGSERPELVQIGERRVACHRAGEADERAG